MVMMKAKKDTQEFVAELRSRINPAYADVIGTESHERKQCADMIESLLAQIEMLRTGDTCARHCEGTAYRIEARRLAIEIERLHEALKLASAAASTSVLAGRSAPNAE
jgi:hypothetical protein